jgi:drug/metabolite transporter (DMT)-like permease
MSKLVLPETGPVVLSGFSFFVSGLLLVPYRPKQVPSRGSWKYVLLFALLGAGVAPLIYQTGLDETTAVNASLLSNGEALFTTLIAFAAFGERLPRRQLARGLLILAGIVLVTTNLDLSSVKFAQGLAGNLLVLGATFFWSMENNLLIAPTRRFGALLITKYRNLLGGGLVTALALALGVEWTLSYQGAFDLAILAVCLAATSYLAIVSLADIGAIRAILVFSTTTIFGAVFALVILKEEITLVQLTGGALILAGVYLLQRAERKGQSGEAAEAFR